MRMTLWRRWRLWLSLLAIGGCVATLQPACCTSHYRDDGRVGERRYYRIDRCFGGERVVCDSATRLPDPATWTEGCR